MTLRERLEWLTRMTFLLFILASAAFLSAITAMRIAIHGREVTMPNLVGKNVSEASQLLQSRGLVLRVADRIYSDQPMNAVVIQTPRPGAGASSPRVDVLVSQGPRENTYVMPHLIGLNETDAQHRLDVAQLRRKVNYVTAPQWPHGAVIDQSPHGGARIPASSLIELTVAN